MKQTVIFAQYQVLSKSINVQPGDMHRAALTIQGLNCNKFGQY